MSEFSGYFDRLADQQIRERTSPRHPTSPTRQRPRGRSGLADRLRGLADRVDG